MIALSKCIASARQVELISLTKQDAIAILNIDHGKKNPIDSTMIGEIYTALKDLRDDPEIHGLVLGSASDRFFSIGFDIPNLFDLSRVDFGTFYKAFTELCLELYTFPKPTAAAVQGHATAGGFILTLACDYRICSRGNVLLGLNEAKLGVPVPWFSELVLEAKAGKNNAKTLIDEGEFFLPEDALKMGIIDDILEKDEVLPNALVAASDVTPDIMDVFRTIKSARTDRIEKNVVKTMGEKTEAFLDRWYAPEVRENLKEAMKKY